MPANSMASGVQEPAAVAQHDMEDDVAADMASYVAVNGIQLHLQEKNTTQETNYPLSSPLEPLHITSLCALPIW